MGRVSGWLYDMHATTFITCLERNGIDTKTATSTTIQTTSDGTRRFRPLFVTIEIDAQSGSITSVCTLSIGTNAATYNNLLVATSMTGLSALNKMLSIMLPATVIDSMAASTDVRVNVTIASIGIGATQTMTVRVFGYYA